MSYQLPNQETRVKALLDNIKNSNTELQAAIALIRSNEADDGKLKSFELTAAYIIPQDPVVKRLMANRKCNGKALILGVTRSPNNKKECLGCNNLWGCLSWENRRGV